MNITLTSHDRLIRQMVKLQKDYPFFSYILMHFKLTAATDNKAIDTAAVNKYGNFFYSEKYVDTLSDDETRGLLIHEAMHIAKGDFFRMGKRNLLLWNIASDAIINHMLITDHITIPKGAINPNISGDVTLGGKRYNVKDKTTEEFYEELLTDTPQIKISGNGHGGFDQHLPDDSDGQGGSTGEEEQEGSIASSHMENKWKKTIIEASTNARARGKLPGCVESIVDKILNPVIDWRRRVQNFITNEIPVDYTNRLPSRKFYGTGVWAPKVLRENLDVFISVDVSGSTMPDREYFISEVAGILNSYEQVKARLIFWDYVVHPENDFLITRSNKDNLTNLKIKDCNGGTRLSSYTDYLESKGYKCRLHIILTDGEVESNPKLPDGNIIFVLTKHGTDNCIKKAGAICRLSDIEND